MFIGVYKLRWILQGEEKMDGQTLDGGLTVSFQEGMGEVYIYALSDLNMYWTHFSIPFLFFVYTF